MKTSLRIALIVAAAAAPGRAAAQDREPLEAALAIQQSFVDAVRRVEQSVVAIMIDRPGSPQMAISLNGRIIIDRGGIATAQATPSFDAVKSPDFVPLAFGSGVIIDPKGLILTNYHVVDHDQEPEAADAPGQFPMARPAPTRPQTAIYTVLTDGRVFPAQIYAADPRSDLAVLRMISDPQRPINDQPAVQYLSAIPLGDASQVTKGQFVLSLGNPFAVARDGSPSVSWGIISNIGRMAEPLPFPYAGAERRPTLHHHGTLLQTDARLNLGTSGGALINLRGEMIGLTTSLAALSGYEQSAGYAIPINPAIRRIIATLAEGREVEYGFLGINLGARLGNPATGVVVNEALPGTPAFTSDLRPGDVIVEINGRRIVENEDLVLAVGTLPPGTEVQVRLNRGGRSQTLSVPLAKFPMLDRDRIIATVQPAPWRGIRIDYATAWQELLSPGLSRFGAPRPSPIPEHGCVLVTSVEPGSAAAMAGIEPGDLITQIGAAPVRSPQEFKTVIGQLGDRSTDVSVHIKGKKSLDPS